MGATRRAVRALRRRVFPGTGAYWDRRYRRHGTSGDGSYGAFAAFKADFLNRFVTERSIRTVVEFGCGDGHQLSLSRYPEYLGFDVSPKAIEICERRFADDRSKRFLLYDPESFEATPLADLALSLDVILHLVEPVLFDQHLGHLFGSASRFVIIYGVDRDVDPVDTAAHVRFRKFTDVIATRFPDWVLEASSPGIEPDNADGVRTDFFAYKRA